MVQLLLRYGTRALWSLSPSRQLHIKRRAEQIREIYDASQSNAQECTGSSPDNTSMTPRPSFPLIAGMGNPERICIILQKRIAEYAQEISNQPGLAYENRELDATITKVMGTPKSFHAVDIADLLQAYVGAYIYDNILLSKDSLDELNNQNWESNLHVWLQHNFDPKLRPGMPALVIDTALSFKALVDDLQLELSWPHSGVDFDEDSMVSWSRDVPRNSTVLFALTFTVNYRNIQETDGEGTDDEETDDEETDDEETDDEETDDEETDDKGTDDKGTDDEGTDNERTDNEGTDDEGTDAGTKYQVLYPSTVILQKERKLAKAHQADEIDRLRHMLVSDRRVWCPIQSSALQVDRDWCGFLIKETHAREEGLGSERPTKRRRL